MLFKNRHFPLSNFPHGFNIDAHIIMDQNIAQPRDTAPWDFDVPTAEFPGKPLGRFAYNLELPDYSVLPVRVRNKNSVADRNVGLDFFDGIRDVLKIDVIAVHKLTTSLRTDSLM